jgi:hypothetical protein
MRKLKVVLLFIPKRLKEILLKQRQYFIAYSVRGFLYKNSLVTALVAYTVH